MFGLKKNRIRFGMSSVTLEQIPQIRETPESGTLKQTSLQETLHIINRDSFPLPYAAVKDK